MCEKILDLASELIDRDEYIEAERILTGINPEAVSLRLEKQLLLSYVKYYKKEYSEAVDLFEDIHANLLYDTDNEGKFDDYYFLMAIYRGMGEHDAVVFYGKSAVTMLEQCNLENRNYWLSDLFNSIAMAYAEKGDLDKALHYLGKMKEVCESPEDWIRYYRDYAYVLSASDIIMAFECCLKGLALITPDKMIEGTDYLLLRLFYCCINIIDYKLAKIILNAVENHFPKCEGLDGARKYLPKYSLQYLPSLWNTTQFEKQIKSELKRLRLVE